jgi:ribosomal protein L37E
MDSVDNDWEESCIKCTECGWPAFAVTREYAEGEIGRFNSYFDSLSEKDQQSNYGGKRSTLDQYIGCRRCTSTSFRRANRGEVSDSITLNPIIFDLANVSS